MIRSCRRSQPGSGYYTTTAIADHGIKYLKEHADGRPGPAVLPLSRVQCASFSLAGAAGRHRPVSRSISRRLGGRARGAMEADPGARPGRAAGCRTWSAEVGPPYDFPEGPRNARARRGQPSRAVGHAHRRAASVSGDQDGDPRGDGRPDGPRDRPGARPARAMGAFENTLIFFCPTTARAPRSWSATTVTTGRRPPARRPRTSAWGRAGRPSPTRRFAATRPGFTKGGSPRRWSSTGPKGSRHAASSGTIPATVIDIVPTILQVAR